VADEDNAWHVDKKVPITLLAAIIIQTFTFGWWAATISVRVTNLEGVTAVQATEFAKLNVAREDLRLQLSSIQVRVDQVLTAVKTPQETSPPRPH